MTHVESKGYCARCKQDTVIRRKLPEPTAAYRLLTLLSGGIWPLYSIRVGWTCAVCGGKADNESPHLVGRRMGGLKTLPYLEKWDRCDVCEKQATLWRAFPSALSPHSMLSFITAGMWPYHWNRFGWRCRKFGHAVAYDALPPEKIALSAEGHCPACNQTARMTRTAPGMRMPHKGLSLITLGSWPFQWLAFGWRCEDCGAGPDEKIPPAPGAAVTTQALCAACGEAAAFTRNAPKFNFFHRIMSLITLGFWPFYWIGKGWRCQQCNKKSRINLFESPEEAPAVPVAADAVREEAAEPSEPEPPEAPDARAETDEPAGPLIQKETPEDNSAASDADREPAPDPAPPDDDPIEKKDDAQA